MCTFEMDHLFWRATLVVGVVFILMSLGQLVLNIGDSQSAWGTLTGGALVDAVGGVLWHRSK